MSDPKDKAPAAPGFDLSQWDTVSKSEEGARCYLRDLASGETTELYIALRGEDSAAYREAKGELDRRRLRETLRNPENAGDRSFEDDEIELLSRLGIEWNLVENGEPIEFSRKELARVLKAYPKIRKQVNAFVHNSRHFLSR